MRNILGILRRKYRGDIDARAAARLDCIAVSLAFDSDVNLRFADFYYDALLLNDTNLKNQFIAALKDI